MNVTRNQIIRMRYLRRMGDPDPGLKRQPGDSARPTSWRLDDVLGKPHGLPHARTTSGQEDTRHDKPRLWLRRSTDGGVTPAPGNMADRLRGGHTSVYCCESYSTG